MATVTKWTPFGVALDVTATGSTVTRTSATQYTVKINVSWETYYSGAQTNYGMTAASGGVTHTISAFNGTKRSSGSGSFTGTYSISGNSSATKTITVTFRNFNTDNGDSATKNVTFNVTVPAWTSYKITYNANGGSGAPSSQTKWKDQTLTLSSTKPTRTGYSFLGWSTSSSATSATYSAGGNYTANAAATLYAVWKANTYTVKYNANGGSGAPGNQTKTYGVTLKLSTTIPTRTNYTFKGWGTSASATTVSYTAGANYTNNAAVTLYAIWELSYVNPIISDFTVGRCSSDGTANDEGTYASVAFGFECTYDVTSITIEWKSSTDSTWQSTTVSATGKTGNVNKIIGSGSLSIDKSYRIRITVADTYDNTIITKVISGASYLIDIRKGGTGLGFGKAAEEDGVASFGFRMKSTYGELISSPTEVPEGTHLDDLTTPGHYIIGNTTLSITIQGKPLWFADNNGTAYIEVIKYGDGAQIVQKFYPCKKSEQFEISRMRYSGTWSNWMITGGCTEWTNLTISSGFEVYTSGSTTPKYRVNGNLVTITGAVKPTATVTSSATDIPILSGIPAQYRPTFSQTFICQGSGINRWLLTVKSDGVVYAGRYGTNEYVNMPTGAWLTFTVTYSI